MTTKDKEEAIKSLKEFEKKCEEDRKIFEHFSTMKEEWRIQSEERKINNRSWLKDIVRKAHEDVSKWSKEKYEFLRKQI